MTKDSKKPFYCQHIHAQPFRLGLEEASYLADIHTSTPAKREMSQPDMG
jgi:hypothetical protein